MSGRHAIPVGDDETVIGIHYGADSNDWLLFCHGFRSNKDDGYDRRCRRAAKEGYNAVRFDFRGCGESDRDFIEHTLSTRLEDLRAVVEYFDPESYVPFGFSFGAKVAFWTAARDDRAEAVLARAPATYDLGMEDRRTIIESEGVYDYEDSHHAIDERLLDDLEQYDFADAAAEIDVPVAIFHGSADRKIPFELSLRATEDLDTEVLLQKLPGEGHRFSSAGEERMFAQAFDWLELVRE